MMLTDEEFATLKSIWVEAGKPMKQGAYAEFDTGYDDLEDMYEHIVPAKSKYRSLIQKEYLIKHGGRCVMTYLAWDALFAAGQIPPGNDMTTLLTNAIEWLEAEVAKPCKVIPFPAKQA
jgi:hypothetical protein